MVRPVDRVLKDGTACGARGDHGVPMVRPVDRVLKVNAGEAVCR